MRRNEAGISGLLAAAFAFYVLFDQFGLLAWAQSRWGVGLPDLAFSLGSLIVSGGLAAALGALLIWRFNPSPLFRLRSIGAAHLLEGGLGLWCLSAETPEELSLRLAVVGLVQGLHIVLILGLFTRGIGRSRLGMWSAVSAGLAYCIANGAMAVLPGDPLFLCKAAGAFSFLVGAAAVLWAGRAEWRPELGPCDAEKGRLRLLAALFVAVVLDSALWQMMAGPWAGATALHGDAGPCQWLANGGLHAAGALAAGLLWKRLGQRRLAGLGALLIGLTALLLTAFEGRGAELVMIFQSLAVAFYTVALFSAWAVVGERGIGWGMALVGFGGSPLGVGLGMGLGRYPHLGLILISAAGLASGIIFFRGDRR